MNTYHERMIELWMEAARLKEEIEEMEVNRKAEKEDNDKS